MNTKHILIAALLAGAFAPASAWASFAAAGALVEFNLDAPEGGGDSGPGKHDAVRERFLVPGPDAGHLPSFDPGRFTGPLMQHHGRAVKNAPYSAEVISEQQQNLADGNQIVNKTSTMSYRDSAGRTRQEVRDASGSVRTVTIHDPVEGSTWILRPDAKSATRIGAHGDIARIAADKARAAADQAGAAADRARAAGDRARAAADQARIRIEQAHKDGGEQVIVKRIERTGPGDGELGARVRENVRIRVEKDMAEGHAMPGMERFGPMIAGAFGDAKYASKAVTRDLGSREIEGVKAQGKLRSYEIPAGDIGNRNPIVVANETWYSPELQVTLLSKRSDPRVGERIYRVQDLKRGEPAPALFTVPSDYTVRDVMANAKKSLEEKK